jgi:FtsH-binding integral membrane protein
MSKNIPQSQKKAPSREKQLLNALEEHQTTLKMGVFDRILWMIALTMATCGAIVHWQLLSAEILFSWTYLMPVTLAFLFVAFSPQTRETNYWFAFIAGLLITPTIYYTATLGGGMEAIFTAMAMTFLLAGPVSLALSKWDWLRENLTPIYAFAFIALITLIAIDCLPLFGIAANQALAGALGAALFSVLMAADLFRLADDIITEEDVPSRAHLLYLNILNLFLDCLRMVNEWMPADGEDATSRMSIVATIAAVISVFYVVYKIVEALCPSITEALSPTVSEDEAAKAERRNNAIRETLAEDRFLNLDLNLKANQVGPSLANTFLDKKITMTNIREYQDLLKKQEQGSSTSTESVTSGTHNQLA